MKRANEENLENLEQEIKQMTTEKQENEREIELVKKEADQVEGNVCGFIVLTIHGADIIRLQMAEHLRKSEAEVNELLAAYWTLRRETGMQMTSQGLYYPDLDVDIYMETLAKKLNMTVVAE